MLAAILLGAVAGSSDLGMAGVMAGQSAAAQQQINFTRDNEYEADRVGISTLAAAGFDPNSMASFFETLGRRYGMGDADNMRILEFLQTHPLSSQRVAEARNRAAAYPTVRPVDSTGYRLARERLRVMTLPVGADPRTIYADAGSADDPNVAEYRYYGRALALVAAGDAAEAVPIFRDLVRRHPTVIEYHTALGEAQLAAGQVRQARETLARAKELFPRNVPVTVRYADALLRADEPKLAHSVLLDLFNNVPPTQAQVRQIALAASAAGEAAEANYYMAEYHVMSGELPLAIETLRVALATPDLTAVQRSRFRARIDELKEYLPPKMQAAVDRGEPLPTEAPRGPGR
jgi:predicted Zn-dependent protease